MDEFKNSSETQETQNVSLGKSSKSFRTKVILAISIATVLLIVGIVVVLLNKRQPAASTDKQSNQSNQTAQSQSLFMQQNGNGCKQREVAFTSAPMKMDQLAYIRPLGAMSDGHVTPTDHVYIGGPNPDAADNTYPVLMPADGTVTTVSAMPAQYIGDRQGQQVAAEDHRIVISHSCRYFSIYIHIHKLGDKLKAAVGSLQPNENKQTSVELKAGEIVGYIGGSTFDWTPIDTSVTLKGFITPSRYDGESWKIHTVSPFDLYTGELKAQLEAKSLRTVAPLGGKIDYDEPGKLAGNWFREGSGGYSGQNDNNGGRYWDGHLSVVPDYIDPASTVVSIGNWKGNAGQFVVKGVHDPAKVSEKEGIVKYELLRFTYETATPGGDARIPTKGMHPSQNSTLEGTILFQVLPGEKLKLEKFPGKTAGQITGFTAAAQTYER